MSFEVALGTLGKALDQLSTLKVPFSGKSQVVKTPAVVAQAKPAKAAPIKAAPAKPAAVKTAPKGGAKAPKPAAVAKPATKPAKAPKSTDANVSSVAAGRRAVASGERPKLVDAMWIVMGDEQMNSAQVIQALETKGWMPNATKPQGYISFMLSKNANMFERIERGVYKRVDGAGPEGYAESKKKASVKAAPAAAATAKAPKKTATKGAPSGKAVRVASAQAEDVQEPAQASASEDSSAASDPPTSIDTDSTLSGVGLSENGDEPVANPFADG